MMQSEMMEIRRRVHGCVFFFLIPRFSSSVSFQSSVLSSFLFQPLESCFFSLPFSSFFVAGHHTLAI